MEDIVFREMTIDRTRDDKSRVVTASLSSTEPYERFFGYEILEHSADAIDLTRAKDGLPLLFSHQQESIIGVVEDVKIEGDKLRGRLRFGNSSQANEIWKDVQDGIIKNMSIGYIVDETKQTGERNGIPEFTVTKWRVLEASVVGVPADATVGMGRSYKPLKLKGKENMNEENMSRSQRRNEKNTLEEKRAAEDDRKSEIMAVVKFYADSLPGLREKGVQAITSKMDCRQFSDYVLDELAKKSQDLNLTPSSDGYGFGGGENQKYSFSKAVRALTDSKEQRHAGYEIERSNELAKIMGRETRGLFIPVGELSKRELTVGGTGSNIVATDFSGSSFIDLLRASSVIMQRATLLPGLIGDTDIPLKSSGTTGYWIGGDGSDSLTESTPVMSKMTLSPKTVGAYMKYSHRMLTQSALNLDDIFMQDMADVLAVEIDAKAVAGDGTGNTPIGIINTSGVLTSTVASAGSPTFVELVEFETAVLNSNVQDSPKLTYLTTPTVAGNLKTTTKDSGSGQMLWENGLLNGRPAQASNNIPSNGMVFGDFSNVIIGTWGVIELLADPYGSNFATGSVSLRALLDIDVAIRRAGAFCINA